MAGAAGSPRASSWPSAEWQEEIWRSWERLALSRSPQSVQAPDEERVGGSMPRSFLRATGSRLWDTSHSTCGITTRPFRIKISNSNFSSFFLFGKQTRGTAVHFVWIVDDNNIEKYMYLIHIANTQAQGYRGQGNKQSEYCFSRLKYYGSGGGNSRKKYFWSLLSRGLLSMYVWYTHAYLHEIHMCLYLIQGWAKLVYRCLYGK